MGQRGYREGVLQEEFFGLLGVPFISSYFLYSTRTKLNKYDKGRRGQTLQKIVTIPKEPHISAVTDPLNKLVQQGL